MLHPPLLDNWFKEIVCPFQIQDAQKSVDRYEDKRPMQTSSRPDNDIVGHAKENQKDSWIDYASDKDPASIKADRYEICHLL